MQWQVLDENTRAMDLYKRIGGRVAEEIVTIRMPHPVLTQFATGNIGKI